MTGIKRHSGRVLGAALVAGGSAIAASFGLGVSHATPPSPLPNPDRPAVTPTTGEPERSQARSTRSTCRAMRGRARSGNSGASLVVLDLSTGATVCSLNPNRRRSLASNTKILTTAALLERLGPSRRLQTRLFTDGTVDGDKVLRGNLFLKGGGDPALGNGLFLRNYLGGAGTNIDSLARQLRRAGVKRVAGYVFGDESVFDGLRGTADSGYATSPWIGPLSGLSINAGFTGASLSRFSSNPARLAALTLAKRLRKRGIAVRARVGLRKTPAAIARDRPLATVRSRDMAWMSRVTNVDSNNFFAEMLVKALGAVAVGRGSTSAGTRVVRRVASSLGVRAFPVDGSGLSVSNRATAKAMARLLGNILERPWWGHFYRSLPIAGREGTVADRMRGTAAEGRCRTKTGTLTGVSTLSGYCFKRSGRKYAFSILMNGVSDTSAARAGQDRIAALVAGL